MNDTPQTGEERLIELAKEHRGLFERVADVDHDEVSRRFGEKPLEFLEEHTDDSSAQTSQQAESDKEGPVEDKETPELTCEFCGEAITSYREHLADCADAQAALDGGDSDR